MSFILDALKKSEHERQRQTMPGLMESGIVRPRPRLPVWAIALCGLLGINLVVLTIVLLHGGMAPATPVISAPLPPPVPASATAGTHFSPLDSAPVYAPEIPVPESVPQSPTAVFQASRQPDAAGPVDHIPHRREPVLNNDDYKAADEEVLPTVNELNLTGNQALPELHLDVHVFATQSAERFVFINMRKYHEGATLQEGPTIERIRRDGVILDYQGLRFLLPRQ